eukprot:gnl/MRDRNA2_/MRDRNA2_137198_c0_seq1.p1 gnl/MRDRNA2_/MRDRNA2_137198_c0~~gnl/MRDRNA2_/MRDRNA2_137198_c0_seq1.p1  ORF type:complete len:232 (+),score=58.48 gnl/MRDRNA2_/MRDRNA2_137198_c0_seq1:51-698(+)
MIPITQPIAPHQLLIVFDPPTPLPFTAEQERLLEARLLTHFNGCRLRIYRGCDEWGQFIRKYWWFEMRSEEDCQWLREVMDEWAESDFNFGGVSYWFAIDDDPTMGGAIGRRDDEEKSSEEEPEPATELGKWLKEVGTPQGGTFEPCNLLGYEAAFAAKHGDDLPALMRAYKEESGYDEKALFADGGISGMRHKLLFRRWFQSMRFKLLCRRHGI